MYVGHRNLVPNTNLNSGESESEVNAEEEAAPIDGEAATASVVAAATVPATVTAIEAGRRRKLAAPLEQCLECVTRVSVTKP